MTGGSIILPKITAIISPIKNLIPGLTSLSRQILSLLLFLFIIQNLRKSSEFFLDTITHRYWDADPSILYYFQFGYLI